MTTLFDDDRVAGEARRTFRSSSSTRCSRSRTASSTSTTASTAAGTIRALVHATSTPARSSRVGRRSPSSSSRTRSTKGKKRDLKTKIREAILAMRLEHELTKNQILEDYLNLVPFGNNAYGIEVAAERYFDETMVQLTLPQSALLAGLVQAPSALDPITHPGRRPPGAAPGAARRWSRRTRSPLRQAGGRERGAAADEALLPEASQRSYYIDALLDQLHEPEPEPAVGSRQRARHARAPRRSSCLYEGGLRDLHELRPGDAVRGEPRDHQDRPAEPDRSSRRALVSIDNTNGAVRAVAFGRGYDASQFDPAVDGPGRQAGSSFKGITLAAALSSGYSPDDRVSGSSLSWRIGPGNGQRLVLQPLRRLSRRRPDARPRRSRSPTTARSCAPSSRSAPATTATTARGRVIDDGEPHGHRHVALRSRSCRPRSGPTACTRSRWRRRTR